MKNELNGDVGGGKEFPAGLISYVAKLLLLYFGRHISVHVLKKKKVQKVWAIVKNLTQLSIFMYKTNELKT